MGPVLLHSAGSTLKMSPLDKGFILVHPALPQSSLHWEMCWKVALFFLQLPLLGHWGCAGVELLESVLSGVVICRELRNTGDPRVVTPREHQEAINGLETLIVRRGWEETDAKSCGLSDRCTGWRLQLHDPCEVFLLKILWIILIHRSDLMLVCCFASCYWSDFYVILNILKCALHHCKCF